MTTSQKKLSKRTFEILPLLVSCVLAFGCSYLPHARSDSDILGLRIGMSKTEAHKRLNELGRLESEGSKQEEIWTLNDDQNYSHLILGLDKEAESVRYITVKARENGMPVKYQDVIDTNKATHTTSANNHKFAQEIEGGLAAPGYVKIASGKDETTLTYFSLKQLNSSEEEEEDEGAR